MRYAQKRVSIKTHVQQAKAHKKIPSDIGIIAISLSFIIL